MAVGLDPVAVHGMSSQELVEAHTVIHLLSIEKHFCIDGYRKTPPHLLGKTFEVAGFALQPLPSGRRIVVLQGSKGPPTERWSSANF